MKWSSLLVGRIDLKEIIADHSYVLTAFSTKRVPSSWTVSVYDAGFAEHSAIALQC